MQRDTDQPRTKRIISKVMWLLLAGCLLLVACGGQKEHTLVGQTMGTTYHIKVVAGRSVDMKTLQTRVDARLEQINQSMSTYRPDSEINRFNALNETATPFAISPDFLRVMLAAREVYRLTGGALDCTVQPLVNLWGFGQQGPLDQVPTAAEVESVRALVGFDRIDIAVSGHLSKQRPDVTLDLGAIAKGYGVDQVAILLNGMGFRQFLVEIGGEVYAAGQRLDGRPWRVGINQPERNAPADAIHAVVQLQDRALATSGDYRQYYEIDGRLFAHILDPRTGYPVRTDVVSATVIADNCTFADGLATALVVMAAGEGLALLDDLPGVEGLIITRSADGTLTNLPSQGFAALVD
ncbi:MAG: FAD:protein FMN transferase [Desulfatitalea sp.]|nr:FAD:protein FMN transferase [Desulfatitalea sp.]